MLWLSKSITEPGFDREVSYLKLLHEESHQHDRIVKPIASAIIGPQLSILFPLADLNLDMFLRGDSLSPAECDMGLLLSELIALANALHYLHVTPGLTLPGCHGNLKPTNVLLYDVSKNHGVGTWKLTDFGSSIIDQTKGGDSIPSQPVTIPSGARDRPHRMRGHYQAPEVVHDGAVSPASDIWSFGCILVRVFAFKLDGLEGLRRLDTLRLGGDGDAVNSVFFSRHFYTGDPPLLNPHISNWITSLPKAGRNARFLQTCAGLLEYSLKIDKTTRLQAANVEESLVQLRLMYHRPNDTDDAVHPGMNLPASSIGPSRKKPSPELSLTQGFQSSMPNRFSVSDSEISDRATDLTLAIESQNLDEVRRCLSGNVDLEIPNSEGYTPLAIAVQLGEESIVEHPLAAGASVDSRSVRGQTPLMIAILNDRIRLAWLLLKRGADCMAYSAEGLTCLHYAAGWGSCTGIQLLVQYQATVDIPTLDSNAETPLFTLIKSYMRVKEWEEEFRALVRAGADVNQVNRSGISPLIYAAKEGYTNAVKLLMECNADGTNVILSSVDVSPTIRKLVRRYAKLHQLHGNESRLRRKTSNPLMALPFQKGIDEDRPSDSTFSVPRDRKDAQYLREKLQAIGYDPKEIESLFRENQYDSPWIYFEPTIPLQHKMQVGHHIFRCSHSLQRNGRLEPAYGSATLAPDPERTAGDREDTIRIIEELCGIGGIAPRSRNRAHWGGTVQLEENRDTMTVVYTLFTDGLGILSRDTIESRVSRALANLCSALGLLQADGLCCDSFTVIKYQGPRSTIDEVSTGGIVSVSFQVVADLAAALEDFQKTGRVAAMNKLSDTAEAILKLILPESEMGGPHDPVNHCLHLSALAVQFLCLGLLTYVQAHIGPIQPFFLDTAISRAELWGINKNKEYPHLIAKLVGITCLNEMSHGPVWMFFNGRENSQLQSAPVSQASEKCDIVGHVCDILDTWGPGNLVYRRDDTISPVAVQIGGGFIFGADGTKLHWAREIDQSTSVHHIDITQPVRIGALTSKNPNCKLDEDICRRQSANVLEYLGTSTASWIRSQRQIGLQGGEFVIGQYFETWNKQRGVSVKEIALSKPDDELVQYMDEYWGVQVSYCTGVARRVLLRTVISDLLRAFPDDAELDLEPLENAMRNSSCKPRELLNSLPQNLRQRTLDVVRAILDNLKLTGLDSTGKYFCIAWPFQGDLTRCFKVPLEGQSSWARFLADSHDTATFAYITMDCLETDSVRCRGTQKLRQDDMYLLETAVTRTIRDSQDPWTLKHDDVYFFSKLDSIFWVKVQREQKDQPAGLVELLFLESLPRGLRQRLYMTEKKKQRGRLRECPTVWADGEPVSISSMRRSH